MKHPDDNQTIDMIEETTRRGRKPLAAAEPVTDVVNLDALQEANSAAAQVVLLEQQHTREVSALAIQIGYDGRLEIGAIEDRIRSHMRRTVEECLELGKCLLLLKEMSAHGEFTKRLDLFGIHERVARRLMGATLKFSKTDSKSVLMAAGSQTKMLELVVLDDAEVEQLNRGESVSGLTLDAIESMSTTELRLALRDHKQRLEAKDKVLSDRNEKLQAAEERLHRPYKPSKHAAARNEREKSALDVIRTAATAMNGSLLDAAQVLNDLSEQDGISQSCHDAARNDLVWVAHRLAAVMREHGIELDLAAEIVPSWVREVEATTAEKQKGG